MYKRIGSIFMSGVIMCSLIACGGKGNTTTSEQNSAVNWPKNVEIVVPAGAGGDTDFNARLLAQKLSEKLPANFVVSNVNGNGGATGTRQVKDADNDGSSILFYHSAFLVNKMCGATDYGFEAYNFSSIAAKNVGNVIIVNTSLGINTLDELYAYTKENPGKLKIAAQTGATSYAVAMQMKNAGFKLNIVDAGSAADRLAALLGGHVDVILAAYGSVKDYVKEGTLVPLAMDGTDDLVVENEQINIKTFKNQGYNEIELPFYYFFAFPQGTNDELVEEFNNAVQAIVEGDNEYREKIFASYYQQPTFYAREAGLEQFIEVEMLLSSVDFTTN